MVASWGMRSMLYYVTLSGEVRDMVPASAMTSKIMTYEPFRAAGGGKRASSVTPQLLVTVEGS